MKTIRTDDDCKHLEALIDLKGEHIALLEMRSHGPWYLKGIHKRSTLAQAVVTNTYQRSNSSMHVEEFFDQR
jgi:tRNA-dihydrouridine synthase B